MGCFWSSQAHSQERGLYQYERRQRQLQPHPQPRPRFGEYRCSCGRTWSSRLSWPHGYQKCKRCKKSVYAYSQRELRPFDVSHSKTSTQDHQKELCQMCEQLGYYCGDVNRRGKHSKTYSFRKYI